LGLLFTFSGSAQNLQYSQTLLLSTTSSATDSLGTVPPGKVWKIVASGTEYTSYNSCAFSFNGGTDAAFRVGGVNNYNTGYTQVNSHTNIWLPAGTPVHAIGCSSTYRWLSIIEFNVVP
jgi:hypothetical protein